MNPKRSRSRNGGKMPMVHPSAAAIEVGATMHIAAVRADRAPGPVRSFGAFTADMHRLVDWFTECGVKQLWRSSSRTCLASEPASGRAIVCSRSLRRCKKPNYAEWNLGDVRSTGHKFGQTIGRIQNRSA